ncbi:hypothetical protein VD0001_g6352 [Verticillium dahliae]|nr:hypothetical protein VD0001_g6352 [Verticillium dahliae]
MIAYGYTFVGKGTVQAFIRDLEHEAAVYERLRSIQGANVPVFLGAIDLRPMKKIYYYDHRVTYQRHVGGKSSYVWSGSQLAYGTNGNVLRAGRWTGVNAREAG